MVSETGGGGEEEEGGVMVLGMCGLSSCAVELHTEAARDFVEGVGEGGAEGVEWRWST